MTAPSVTRRARFKRSNSVTAGVQADLELEGLAGLATVATEDKALQFGRSFQRHASEPQPGPRAPTYSVFRTVHTQGQWAYREGYPLPYEPPATDGSPGPAPAPTPGPGASRRDSWMERGSRSLPDSGRTSPCPRDGEWFIKMLRAEVEKLEHWCQQMEREAEDYELPEESEWGAPWAAWRVGGRLPSGWASLGLPWLGSSACISMGAPGSRASWEPLEGGGERLRQPRRVWEGGPGERAGPLRRCWTSRSPRPRGSGALLPLGPCGVQG